MTIDSRQVSWTTEEFEQAYSEKFPPDVAVSFARIAGTIEDATRQYVDTITTNARDTVAAPPPGPDTSDIDENWDRESQAA